LNIGVWYDNKNQKPFKKNILHAKYAKFYPKERKYKNSQETSATFALLLFFAGTEFKRFYAEEPFQH